MIICLVTQISERDKSAVMHLEGGGYMKHFFNVYGDDFQNLVDDVCRIQHLIS